MRNRLIIALLSLGLLLAGYIVLRQGFPAGKAPPVEWSHSPDQVVFQIDTVGGFVPPLVSRSHVPELTVFGDGRVIFLRLDPDGIQRILTAQIPEARLAELLAQANRDLTGLKDRYTAVVVTDAGDTHFAVSTAAGLRSVRVYAFMVSPSEHEQERAVMDRLRAVRTAFLSALPNDASPYVPDVVTLFSVAEPPEERPGRVKDWPESLPPLPALSADDPWQIGTVTLRGDAARAVAAQVPHQSTWLYRQQDRTYAVAVQPEIPTLP